MVKHMKLGMAIAGACALFGAANVHAFNVRAGEWDLSVAGNVNQFYTYTRCDQNANAIFGGLACTAVANQTNTSSSVRSGLLPSAIVFSGKTTQEGFDLSVVFGFYPDTSIGASTFSNGSINMRQNFLTFGDKDMGTIKMGRDLGIFGSDAIINDFTILGVGTTGGNLAPTNTSLGRIGVGYIYADWIPQITYITPSASGWQGSIGIFQPLKTNTAFSAGTGSANLTGHSTPGVQGKLTWDYDAGDVTGRVWAGFFYQRAIALAGDNSVPFSISQVTGLCCIGGTTSALDTANHGVATYAGDAGIKAAYAGWTGYVYYYQGRGIGTTGPLDAGVAANGNKRNSNGGIVQLQYHLGKWTPGISYGVSRLALTSGESVASNGTLVNRNRSGIGQLQYSLTKALSLVVEDTFTKSNNQIGKANIENSIAAGAILFF